MEAKAHYGRCEYCGVATLCNELACREGNGHDYICPECLAYQRGSAARDELAQAELFFD